MTIKISVGKVPGAIGEFVLESGATVADALAIAEIDAVGYDVRLNGDTVTNMNTNVTDGDAILVTRLIKAN